MEKFQACGQWWRQAEILTCAAPRFLASASWINTKACFASTELPQERMLQDSACWEVSVQTFLTVLSLSSNTTWKPISSCYSLLILLGFLYLFLLFPPLPPRVNKTQFSHFLVTKEVLPLWPQVLQGFLNTVTKNEKKQVRRGWRLPERSVSWSSQEWLWSSSAS